MVETGKYKDYQLMEVGCFVTLFVKVRSCYVTGMDFVDRHDVLYMINDDEAKNIGYPPNGDCLLIEARVSEGSMFPVRMCLENVSVIENKGHR